MSVTRNSVQAEGGLDGPANMARDALLLTRAEDGLPGCRVYTWDRAWVTVGRFQKPSETVVDGFEDWVLRPTGGRAVLHGHDMTVGLALPLEGPSRSVKAVYRALVAPLVEALNACGLPAALAENTPYAGLGRASADCFAFSSPNDVVDPNTGRKVCGCALRVTENAALLQASIPYREPLIPPETAIVGGVVLPGRDWRHEDLAVALAACLSSS